MDKTLRNGRLPAAGLQLAAAAARAFIVLLVFMGAACAHWESSTKPQVPVHFAHQDGLDVTWREQKVGGNLEVTGILRNFHPLYLQNLCVTVTLLDKEGKMVES